MDCSVEGIIEITSDYKRIISENDSAMVVIIIAEWCGNCQIMAPILQNLAYQHRRKIKFVMIDADINVEVKTAHDLNALPLFLFYNGSSLFDQARGTVPSSLLNEKMKALIKVSSKNNMSN